MSKGSACGGRKDRQTYTDTTEDIIITSSANTGGTSNKRLWKCMIITCKWFHKDICRRFHRCNILFPSLAALCQDRSSHHGWTCTFPWKGIPVPQQLMGTAFLMLSIFYHAVSGTKLQRHSNELPTWTCFQMCSESIQCFQLSCLQTLADFIVQYLLVPPLYLLFFLGWFTISSSVVWIIRPFRLISHTFQFFNNIFG